MFPRSLRLHRSKDILAVFLHGDKLRSGPITFFFLKNPQSKLQCTVIVDKKISKKAVVRNLLKRHLRAILRHGPLPHGSLLVRCYPGAETLSFEELQTLVQHGLDQAKRKNTWIVSTS